MVKYTVYYFPARGRAETLRLLFAAAGVEFEDVRIPGSEWPQHKASMPMGQMPVLEIDGKKMPQSTAAARYLAKKFKLDGKDDEQAYWIDVYLDSFDDIGKKYPLTEKDETKKAELMKEFCDKIVPEGLKNIEALFIQNTNGDGYLVGENLTLADLGFISSIDFLLINNPNLLDCVPKLDALNKRVREYKGVKEWLAKRPQSEF